MKIQRHTGEEANGWAVAEALRDGTGWDSDGQPFQIKKGERWLVQGNVDENVFSVESPKKPKEKKVKTIEEEVK